MARIVIVLAMVLAVASCGSRLNPLNWFGGSRPVPVATLDTAAVDGRPLMDQVVSVAVAPTPGGAIVRATGLAPRQGWFDAELVAVPSADPGVLSYAFRARPPAGATRVSTPRSREVTAGLFLTNRDIAGVREIQVTGARNARAVRR